MHRMFFEDMVIMSQKRQPICAILSPTTENKTIRCMKLIEHRKEIFTMKYACDVCGWVYDEEVGYPEGGIAPGTKWEDVPEDFECPLCCVGKDQFSEA